MGCYHLIGRDSLIFNWELLVAKSKILKNREKSVYEIAGNFVNVKV